MNTNRSLKKSVDPFEIYPHWFFTPCFFFFFFLPRDVQRSVEYADPQQIPGVSKTIILLRPVHYKKKEIHYDSMALSRCRICLQITTREIVTPCATVSSIFNTEGSHLHRALSLSFHSLSSSRGLCHSEWTTLFCCKVLLTALS